MNLKSGEGEGELSRAVVSRVSVSWHANLHVPEPWRARPAARIFCPTESAARIPPFTTIEADFRNTALRSPLPRIRPHITRTFPPLPLDSFLETGRRALGHSAHAMDDFASETDSDYTSYWRDWVGAFLPVCPFHCIAPPACISGLYKSMCSALAPTLAPHHPSIPTHKSFHSRYFYASLHYAFLH